MPDFGEQKKCPFDRKWNLRGEKRIIKRQFYCICGSSSVFLINRNKQAGQVLKV